LKVIAISQRVDAHPDRNEKRDALDQSMVIFLLQAGLIAIPVPNVLCRKDIFGSRLEQQPLYQWLLALQPVGLVLSGGNDVGQCIARDLTETYMLKYAKKNVLPLLGICRGMQMMALFAGANLRFVKGHVRTRHFISGKIVSEVNSYHSYSLKSCPDGYEVLARSQDGEIEAIRHQKLPWQGWMWHPEREENFSKNDIARAQELFNN
jgi:gamma-glutamyl-gamma-aminobutyrate hydrolase PuuD